MKGVSKMLGRRWRMRGLKPKVLLSNFLVWKPPTGAGDSLKEMADGWNEEGMERRRKWSVLVHFWSWHVTYWWLASCGWFSDGAKPLHYCCCWWCCCWENNRWWTLVFPVSVFINFVSSFRCCSTLLFLSLFPSLLRWSHFPSPLSLLSLFPSLFCCSYSPFPLPLLSLSFFGALKLHLPLPLL